MFQPPGNKEHISLMLSEVLNDIGVNERMVEKRRRAYMLIETMENNTLRSREETTTSYHLGSQIEGTTTCGLESDNDLLGCDHNFNIIQDWSEWEHGKFNYLMIQDENTTPGYCFLQLLRSDIPIHVTKFVDDHHTTDRRGRVLHKNKIRTGDTKDVTQCGPSFVRKEPKGCSETDSVFALPLKSWPHSALGWLDQQGVGNWPKEELIKIAASTQCFVVPKESKVSKYPELEWRISTALAERYLMFDLNITQIRCYVLMKMIFKCFLNPSKEINLSSYMGKTVLFHCIQSKKPSVWKENNLKECLSYCLLELKICVENNLLSQFIIKKNNLMAGQFTAETKQQLLQKINNFMQNDVQILSTITTDDFGKRLQTKLNLIPQRDCNFLHPMSATDNLMSIIIHSNLANQISFNHRYTLYKLQSKGIRTIWQSVEILRACSKSGNKLENTAYKLVTPFLFTTYGTAIASASIGLKCQISPQALVWLVDGSDSDISSGRLKLASVFYRIGEMGKAEQILRLIELQYYSNPVLHFCNCWSKPIQAIPIENGIMRNEHCEECIKHITAFCVRFIKEEINCVPHELQYEMFRSTRDDMIHRDFNDLWMDWAVVDSLPFLYFLQYKVYGHLQRNQDQQEALTKLATTIEKENDLGHKETALNILGQCMEQENRHQQAMNYYLLSLKQRPRNNVAKIHICRLLSKFQAQLADSQGECDVGQDQSHNIFKRLMQMENRIATSDSPLDNQVSMQSIKCMLKICTVKHLFSTERFLPVDLYPLTSLSSCGTCLSPQTIV